MLLRFTTTEKGVIDPKSPAPGRSWVPLILVRGALSLTYPGAVWYLTASTPLMWVSHHSPVTGSAPAHGDLGGPPTSPMPKAKAWVRALVNNLQDARVQLQGQTGWWWSRVLEGVNTVIYYLNQQRYGDFLLTFNDNSLWDEARPSTFLLLWHLTKHNIHMGSWTCIGAVRSWWWWWTLWQIAENEVVAAWSQKSLQQGHHIFLLFS